MAPLFLCVLGHKLVSFFILLVIPRGGVDYDIYPMKATHIKGRVEYGLLSLDICHSP